MLVPPEHPKGDEAAISSSGAITQLAGGVFRWTSADRRTMRAAAWLLSRSSVFTFLMTWLMPRSTRPLFWLWYAYLRVVDDTVDDSSGTKEDRIAYLDRQIRLIEDCYMGVAVPKSRESEFLSRLIRFDRAHGARFRPSLDGMLASIRSEGARDGSPTTYSRLMSQYRLESESYLHAIAAVSGLDVASAPPPGHEAALGAKLAHVLRDFLDDVDNERLNISLEEIASYRLLLPDFGARESSAATREWVANRARLGVLLLRRGLADSAAAKSKRYSLTIAILATKYQVYLHRVKIRGFRLSKSISLARPTTVALLAKNVRAVWGMGEDVGVILVRDRFRKLVSASMHSAISEPFKLALTANLGVKRTLRSVLAGVPIGSAVRWKIMARFVIAYRLGRLIHRAISPNHDRAAQHYAALAYAGWALTAIQADRVVDDVNVRLDVLAAWAEEWLRDFEGTGIVAATKAAEASVGSLDRELLVRFGAQFRADLNRYLARSLEHGVNANSARAAFAVELRLYLAAQVKSAEQRIVTRSRDWRWYVETILDQKTLPFFFAPLSLFADRQSESFRALEAAFLTLNAYYVHWQLLDDVADIADDTARGIVAAPGFMLISQGALADLYCRVEGELAPGDHGLYTLFATIRESALLSREYRETPLTGGFHEALATLDADLPGTLRSPNGAERVLELLRCALANDDGDLRCPLGKLVLDRSEQASAYVTAMRANDPAAAESAIRRSRAASRVLAPLQLYGRRALALQNISGIDRATRDAIRILDRLMFATLKKARRTAEERAA
jgi:phytoene/squalene synthetase